MHKPGGLNTTLVHGGKAEDPHGSAVTPIYQCSTFAFDSAQQGADLFSHKREGYIYTRLGNPTIAALEGCVALLEGGAGAVATSSGMAAVAVTAMTLLEQGTHAVCTASLYGPSRTLLEKTLARFGVGSSFVDTTKLSAVRAAFTPATRLVYVETPSNPMMQITDLAAAAELAHRIGAKLAVDGTFASPALQRPLELGADVVLHSVTKFINGHADVVGGILSARDPELLRALHQTMTLLGCNMDPHQAYLVHRGLKTLDLRVRRAQKGAARLAAWLEGRPEVAWVRYPGLPSHPQHELAARQMSGFGSMLSFEMKGGLEAGRRLMDHVRLILLAVSLGGVESLIEHPASMTHAGLPRAEREAAGITDGLVRLSVGIEEPADLQADLEQALGAL